jgi:LuxR family transcriptional regulator, maltose regulon positive regulatory protein
VESLRLHWLGHLLVEWKGRPIRLETRKAAALLAYISLNPGENPREVLATMFWQEGSQQKGLANLRRTLASLNFSLPGWIEADRETIALKRTGKLWVDVDAFHQSLSQLKEHPHPDNDVCDDCLSTLDQAVELYRGEFMDGLNLADAPVFDDWQFFQRDGLRQEFAGVLQRLTLGRSERGQWEQAILHARRWVSMDHLHEPASRTLMDLYARSGRRTAALHQYEELAWVLREQMGQEPEDETRRLYEQIRGREEAKPVVESPNFPASFPLLKTKLYIPTIPEARVARSHLLARLSDAEKKALTIISAPAGFGKTTLLAEWIAQISLPVAWLSIDHGDNDPNRFIAYLIAALGSIQEDVGLEAQQIMRSPHPAPLHVILASLLNDLGKVVEPYVLVIDDYQFIVERAVHEAMAYLLDHIPSNMHTVIATRADPPLQLGRLRAHGQMMELRTRELRFTSEETTEFLNDVMQLGLSVEDIEALDTRTEGWVAGLKLAALSLQGQENAREFIRAFSGSHRYVLDYLVEEVLRCQPAHIQSFLLKTSILDKMSGPLCDSVMGEEWIQPGRSGQTILEHLEKSNLFVVSLDDHQQWYRYHHLFADLLKSRLALDNSAKISILQVRASVWLEQNGFIIEAIRYLFVAGDTSRAADLIERYGPARLREGDPAIFRMADNLPLELILVRPKIGLYQAWLLITQSRIEKARPLLNDMLEQFAKAGSDFGQRWMKAFVESALAFLSPASGAPGVFPLPAYKLLDEIPAEELILRNSADFLYGMALARRGETDQAIEVSLKCIQREKARHGSPIIPTLTPFLSRIYLIQGRLHASASLCRDYLDPIKRKEIWFIYTAGSMMIDLGEVLYQWGLVEEAEQYIRDGLRSNEFWQNIMTDGFGLVALTRVLIAKREYVGAMQTAEKLEARMREHAKPREFDEDSLTLRVRVQLASGDLQDPSHWADQVVLSEEFALHPELYRLTLGRIDLARGRYIEVEKILAGTTPQITAGSLIARQLESNLLLAAAIAAQQRLPEGLQLLESSLALAEPEGYVQVFLELGEPAYELLVAYLQSVTADHKPYAQKVLEAFSTSR